MINDIALQQYCKSFKKIPDDRLIEIFKYLKENHAQKSFPLINDFNNALRNTRKLKEVVIEPFVRDQEYSSDLLALAEKYRPPKDKEKLKTRKELYTEKLAAGLIFSHKLMKWVDKTLDKNIGGTFIYPEEELKKIISKSKIEFETV
jgi:hypothetical protein